MERGEKLHTNGHIEVICGEMFAGKSEELIRRLRRVKIARQKVQAFKPALDKRRSESTINTYDGQSFPATSVANSEELISLINEDTQVVAVDEAQFFDEGIVKVVRKLAVDGKRVIIAGLDKDFRGEPFGPMGLLLVEAEHVDKLHAICEACGEEASVPQRLINGKPAKYDDPIIMIGEKETYVAVCRHCHRVPGAPE